MSQDIEDPVHLEARKQRAWVAAYISVYVLATALLIAFYLPSGFFTEEVWRRFEERALLGGGHLLGHVMFFALTAILGILVAFLRSLGRGFVLHPKRSAPRRRPS